eukprot:Hpha_TRINITY_DN7782_c1_g1::TRINITY_DN7782_c1_g1_i1::g.85457::m.85457
MDRWCYPLVRCIIRADDNPEEVRVKRQIGPIIFIGLAVNLTVGFQALAAEDYFHTVGRLSWVLACIVFVGCSLTRLVDMGLNLDIALCLTTFTILLIDLSKAAVLRPRVWSLIVLILDTALVFDRPRVVTFSLAVTLAYLLFERGEGGLRWGVFDDIMHPDGVEVCSCVNPPCSVGIVSGLWDYCGMLMVLLVDFHLTRGFASDLNRQLRSVKATVRVASDIAAALAAYDIERAAAVISADELPPGLEDSLYQLLHNLRLYKDYLPDALLEQDSNFDEQHAARRVVPPPGVMPGAEEVPVGVVFTDIESSTTLWDQHPQGMYEGLQIHNNVLRDTAAELNGYEVKVIGDALMLAFANAGDAANFGLAA